MTAKPFGRWDAKEMAFVHGEGPNARIIWTAEDCSYEACDLLNAAVRKYAADAIKDAAKSVDEFDLYAMEALGHHFGTLPDATRLRIADWLRSLADRFEQDNL